MVLTIILTKVLRAYNLRNKTKLRGIQGEIGMVNCVKTKILNKLITKNILTNYNNVYLYCNVYQELIYFTQTLLWSPPWKIFTCPCGESINLTNNNFVPGNKCLMICYRQSRHPDLRQLSGNVHGAERTGGTQEDLLQTAVHLQVHYHQRRVHKWV